MKTNTRRLADTAILIALGTILSMIQIEMPMGGGLTACSMLPLVFLSYRYGWKWGGLAGLIYSLIQMLLGIKNVQYASSAIMALGIIFLDYIFAYSVIGFASLFGGKPTNTRKSLIIGIVVSFLLRFLFHFFSGWWIWNALWPNEFGMAAPVYSLVYNGWYMGAEIILSVAVTMAIYNPLKKYINGEDLK
ncbi:MAG: energy-coupled thiamine transporter ThiT [Oscillospiraceae bacterium]|nr:energy-coupled thiamine transporter ThiT [Oscillospiraceae bacterium]